MAVVVITSIRDAGNHSIGVYGDYLNARVTGSKTIPKYDCETSIGLLACYPAGSYIIGSLWNSLTDSQKDSISSKVKGLVTAEYGHWTRVEVRGDWGNQWTFREESIIPEPELPKPEPELPLDKPTDEPTDDITDEPTDYDVPDEPTDYDVSDEPTDYDVPDEPTEPDMQFDIQSILDSMGMSMKHAKYAIVILIIIFIMSRLA